MLKAIAKRACKTGFACVLGAAFALTPVWGYAKRPTLIDQHGPVAVAQLPAEGRATYALIHEGGPFPYEKDGTIFGNRERLLPAHTRGYYREYTVQTPRARNRGARRIVCGGKPRNPDACYYTADHYASFREIIE